MNTTDAEIAGKLDWVTRGGVQVKKDSHNDTLWVTDGENYIHVESGSDYLDHCRAVVSEVDGERTDKTYTDFMHEWIRRRNNGSNDQPEAAKESVWAWVKWAWKIAATTARHRKKK